MRVLTVFGTRPEVIKLAPVIRAIERRGLQAIVCATGQHRDMLDQTLGAFSLRPDFDLDIMRPNQSPLDVAGRIFMELPPVIEKVRPDWLVVQGDTTTTFAAALVAFHARVPVAHVEAGLRTHDKFHPFPEEANRRLTSVLTDLHFAPTSRSERNLLDEGVAPDRIFVTGNPVVDALGMILNQPVRWSDPRLEILQGRTLLVTAHRRESFGRPLEEICHAIVDLLAAHKDLTVIFPVHPNPSVRETVELLLGNTPRIFLTSPLSYPEFVHLMRLSDLILSDSGGVQEEAPSVGTPVLVLREVTERPEAMESGWAQLVGTSTELICETATQWLKQNKKRQLARAANPFGDGHAGERIADLLESSEDRRPSVIGKETGE